MKEKLFQEYVGKELREFIFNENNHRIINNRTVWINIGNQWNLLYFADNVLSLYRLGGEVRNSLIKDIIADEIDIIIIIKNPFKGVD